MVLGKIWEKSLHDLYVIGLLVVLRFIAFKLGQVSQLGTPVHIEPKIGKYENKAKTHARYERCLWPIRNREAFFPPS